MKDLYNLTCLALQIQECLEWYRLRVDPANLEEWELGSFKFLGFDKNPIIFIYLEFHPYGMPTLRQMEVMDKIRHILGKRTYLLNPMWSIGKTWGAPSPMIGVEIRLAGELYARDLRPLSRIGRITRIYTEYDNVLQSFVVVYWLVFPKPID